MTEGSARVLVFSTDADLRADLTGLLMDVGFEASATDNLVDALRRAAHEMYDLVVVDAGDDKSLYVVAQFKAKSRLPIMALVTTSEAAADCLELGADDCLHWPASPREVLARVELRSRDRGGIPGSIESGSLTIDLTDRRVEMGGQLVDLSDKEFDLLTYLASAAGETFSKDHLLARVWQSSREWQSPKTVSEHIYRLRQKLEPDPGAPQWIVSDPRGGYRFEPSDVDAGNS